MVDLEDRFPVHNDWAYYLAQDYPQEIISSAVTMDPYDESSGPLHVWPGSHKQHLEHHRPPNKRGWEVRPELIDFDGGIDLLAPPGSVMLFHSVLIHNSRPNISGRPAEAHDLQPLPQAKQHRARCEERAQQAQGIALRVGISAGEGPR